MGSQKVNHHTLIGLHEATILINMETKKGMEHMELLIAGILRIGGTLLFYHTMRLEWKITNKNICDT